MTDPASPSQVPDQALLDALAAGPDHLVEQVSCVLHISEQNQPLPPQERIVRRPLTEDQARIRALTNIAERLSEKQRQILYDKIKDIDDVETRLLAYAHLALLLPPALFKTTIRDIWIQSADLEQPDSLATVMFQLAPLLTVAEDEPAAMPVLREIVSIAQAIGNAESRIRSLLILAPHLPDAMRSSVIHRVIDEIERLHSDTHRATAITTLAEQLLPDIEERALNCAQSIQAPAERARAITALARHLPLQPELRGEALATIAAIPEEEERANALIAFAPHLEFATDTEQFPILLEQALHIAVGIKRRHVRVRVLVALAPHLTLDLQGEALAAVHNLSNERERTTLLAELAPYLPPDMLVASLAVAHTIQAQDARTDALSALARYVPQHAREQTMMDALNAASSLPHHYERVSALVALIDVLPPELQEQTQRIILETAAIIDNENARARALSILSPGLPPHLSGQALALARELDSPDHRLTALASLVGTLPADERLPVMHEVIETIQALPFEYKRARALVEVAAFIPPALMNDVLVIAHDLEDPVDRITAYTALIPHLSPETERDILGRAWKLIKEVENGYDAASALAALAPLLPPTAADDIAKTASMIVGSIMDEYDQASAIALLAPLFAADSAAFAGQPPTREAALERGIAAVFEINEPALRQNLLSVGVHLWVEITEPEAGYPLWQLTMRCLARLPLSEVILCLSQLMPVVQQIAGAEAIAPVVELLEHRAVQVAESNQ